MIGRTISHYKILEQIGKGGMGVVYKAEDTKLERVVALKFLPPETVGGEADKARFFNEARAAAALNHPNICTVYEINEADDQAFISMAYVDGKDLHDILREGQMDIGMALGVAVQVAQGLEEAHEQGIVHRDIKAANVMITGKGRALVMDFGLAKRAGLAALTRQGMSMGTIEYMSPEQAQGGEVDKRTDIWSLGVMLYEMIAGQRPFRGDFDQAIIYSIINQEPPSVRDARGDVPARLDDIVRKCMAKSPNDRYQHAGDLLADLRALQGELGLAPQGSDVHSTGFIAPRSASLTERLMTRRVPQVLIIYAILCFAVWQALKWLVHHFPLSPHLPEAGLVAMASLLPSVLLLALARGNGSKRVTRIGIPANLLLSAVLLFFVFQNKDLGAATTTVMVTDEQGNTIERVVPKGEFRKRVAVFYPDNQTGNPEDDWLQYGIVYALENDLNQDLFVTVNIGFTYAHNRAGFPDATGSPLTLKKQIADEYHFPHFVAGSFTRDGDDIVFDAKLYETKRLQPLFSQSYRGNVFEVVDAVSAQLRRDIGVPDYNLDQSTDLPASELLTGSTEAFRSYIVGNRLWVEEQNYESATEHLEKAVALDPSFAPAYWSLHNMYVAMNRPDAAMRSIEAAMKHRYRLPEPAQFALKGDYYGTKQQVEASFENAQRWAALYPLDTKAWEALAEHHERLNQIDAGVEVRKRILELDPGDYNQIRWIGRLYEEGGRFKEALEYYHQYAERFPDNHESFTEMGRLYQLVGEFDNARLNYRKALLIEPDRMSIRVSLANIERKIGNFEGALNQYEELLANSKSARDSLEVLDGLQYYFAYRGQSELAVQANERYQREAEKIWAPVSLLFVKIFSTALYVEAGRVDETFEMLRDMESQKQFPWLKAVVNAGYLIAYGVIDDPANADEAEARLAEYEAWVDASQQENRRWAAHYCRAIIQRWRGDYTGAIESIQKALELMNWNDTDDVAMIHAFAGTCSREMGSFELGQSFLEKTITLEPYHPWAHYELARVYDGLHQRDKALNHLRKALYVWETADPGYQQAREARELLAEWEGAAAQ